MKCAHALAYSIFLPKTLRNTRNSCLYLILYIMADLFDVRREIMDNLLNVDDEDLIEEEIQLFLEFVIRGQQQQQRGVRHARKRKRHVLNYADQWVRYQKWRLAGNHIAGGSLSLALRSPARPGFALGRRFQKHHWIIKGRILSALGRGTRFG